MNHKITAVALIIAGMLAFLAVSGCIASSSSPNSGASVEVASYDFGTIRVVYIPETQCLCHIYRASYAGGISCIPCNQLNVGACP